MLKKLILVLSGILLISGCAGVVKPVTKSSLENKTFVLVPTGQINYEVVSNKVNGFGLIGALVELAVTQSSTDITKQKLQSAIPPDFLMQTAINQIETDIKKYGSYKIIVSKTHTLKDISYAEWSKNTKRDDLKNNSEFNGDIVVDIGVTNISLIKTLSGTYANLWVSIRFINKNTGEMHGEVRDFINSNTVGVNVNLDEDSSNYSIEIRNAFETLVRASVTKALQKVFSNQSL